MRKDDENAYAWLKETGRYAQLQRYDQLGCFIPGLLWFLTAVGVGLAIGTAGKLVWIPIITGIAAVQLKKRAEKILINEIYCPRCGYNPTRRKSDGKPRKDHHKVMNQLLSYQSCPGVFAERVVYFGTTQTLRNTTGLPWFWK